MNFTGIPKVVTLGHTWDVDRD